MKQESLPALYSPLNAHSNLALKIMMHIATWGVREENKVYVLSDSERFRIKVTFLSDGAEDPDPFEYVGTVVAFVNDCYVIVYEDSDIRYEKNSIEFLQEEYAIDEEGNYIS